MTVQKTATSGGGRRNFRGAAFMRLLGLVRKEFVQIIRDPSSISIAFVMPVVLLLLFGYGVSLDAKHLPVAVVIEVPTTEAYGFTGSLAGSDYFSVRIMRHRRDAEAALSRRDVEGFVVLPADFGRRLQFGDASIQVVLHGSDANTARILSGYLDGAWQNWLAKLAASRGRQLTAPVVAEQRVWFNPEVRSRNYLVPGLVAIIMTLIGTLLTSMVLAREWERGTMEALMVTPVTVREILLGKLIPYFTLGMGGMALSTAMAVGLFEVPFRGSLAVLFGVSALFMVAALGMGLFISTIAKSQFVAGQVAIIAAFLPAFILSGFIFDISSMPTVVQILTHVIPARYFVSSLQTLFLAGDIWPIILTDAAVLTLIAAILLGVTLRRMHKSLE
jgi:ABC-2 type transport system permease protein